jgi:hypothetical protein
MKETIFASWKKHIEYLGNMTNYKTYFILWKFMAIWCTNVVAPSKIACP